MFLLEAPKGVTSLATIAKKVMSAVGLIGGGGGGSGVERGRQPGQGQHMT